MSSRDKLTTRKVVRFQKWRGGKVQIDADPWSLNEALHCSYDDWLQGPGISQRAAAARSQRLWRWLVERNYEEN